MHAAKVTLLSTALVYYVFVRIGTSSRGTRTYVRICHVCHVCVCLCVYVSIFVHACPTIELAQKDLTYFTQLKGHLL